MTPQVQSTSPLIPQEGEREAPGRWAVATCPRRPTWLSIRCAKARVIVGSPSLSSATSKGSGSESEGHCPAGVRRARKNPTLDCTVTAFKGGTKWTLMR